MEIDAQSSQMSSLLPDCQFCKRIYLPLVAPVSNHRAYIFAFGTYRDNENILH